jgi:dienelactone hydrolase
MNFYDVKSMQVLLMLIAAFLAQSAHAADCVKYPSPITTLTEVKPGLFAVMGKPADFDACNASVEFKTPNADKPSPLVIISHGGSGAGPAEKNIATEFRKLGFATLLFDAYKMNGHTQDWKFWATQVTNESRQRLNYQATLGAYQWALAQDKVDNRNIYLHGVSNGANVVVNMAGEVDPAHVKGVFAEGTMMSGIGVPDKLNVPVRLIFGKLDNYGGRQPDEWRWLLKEECALNGKTDNFSQPQGSAQRCSLDHNPQALTQSPQEWFQERKQAGDDIDIWWYEDAAHGMFSGPLLRQTRTWGANNMRYAWIGASAAAREKFLIDFRQFTGLK